MQQPSSAHKSLRKRVRWKTSISTNRFPTLKQLKLKISAFLIGELASDAYEGRETGTEGNQKAAEFIAKQFKSYGIAPIPGKEDYFQDVAFTRMRWSEIEMMVDQNKIQHQRDFIMVPGFQPFGGFGSQN